MFSNELSTETVEQTKMIFNKKICQLKVQLYILICIIIIKAQIFIITLIFLLEQTVSLA